MRYFRTSLSLLAPLALSACQMVQPGGMVAPGTTGATVFKDHCVACHGTTGQGDGVLAGELPAPPADLTMLSAANGGAFPRDRVIEIVHGYPGQAHARVMPDFGSRIGGGTVIHETEDGARLPTPAALVALVDYIESLQR